MPRDELYDEFEQFYNVTINGPSMNSDLKFQKVIADALYPHKRELNKFVYTEFYEELVNKKENEK